MFQFGFITVSSGFSVYTAKNSEIKKYAVKKTNVGKERAFIVANFVVSRNHFKNKTA